MAHSTSPHSRETKNKLLAAYMVLDNISAAAREIGIPERTANGYVNDARSGKDEEGAVLLAKLGDELRARASAEASRLLQKISRATERAIDVAVDRIENPDWVGGFKSDPTPNYMTAVTGAGKQVLDLLRYADQLAGKGVTNDGPSVVILAAPFEDDEDPPPEAA